MSYINIKESIPNFKKAVISFWFRVPQTSFDKLKEVTNKESGQSTPLPPLHGILPLVTFGKIYDGRNYHLKANDADASYSMHFWIHNCNGWTEIGDPEQHQYSTGSSIVLDEVIHADPSYIGILYITGQEADSDGRGGTPDSYLLAMRLQTASYGSPKMMRTKNSFFHSDENSGNAVFPDECGEGPQESHCSPGVGCVTATVAPDNPTVDITTTEDISSEVFKKGILLPDYFQVAVTTEITPDAWHHVLVSFNLDYDMSATGTFASSESISCDCTSTTKITHPGFKVPCKIFIALDDVNCDGAKLTRGFNLGHEDVPGDTIPEFLGKNDWLSNFTLQAYYGGSSTNHTIAWGVTGQVKDSTSGGVSAPSYTFSKEAGVASEDGPFGIPAGDNVVDRILTVSMAEFLMFTDFEGDVLDTSIEGNRRHFISGPNDKRNQFPTNSSLLYIPMRKFAFGDPVTWEPGADNPAFAPPLFDPSAWPTAIKINGKAAIATIDFTKCQFNWQMGRNLGKSKSKVERIGKVRAYYHDPKIEAVE